MDQPISLILPTAPIPTNRVLAVQEVVTGIPTALSPTVYSGIGSELYVAGDTDPGATAIAGSYSAAEIMVGNGYNYPALSQFLIINGGS